MRGSFDCLVIGLMLNVNHVHSRASFFMKVMERIEMSKHNVCNNLTHLVSGQRKPAIKII